METGHIILKHIPKDVKVEYSDLLREGAPVEPVPEATQWKPEPWQFFQDGARIEAGFRFVWYAFVICNVYIPKSKSCLQYNCEQILPQLFIC